MTSVRTSTRLFLSIRIIDRKGFGYNEHPLRVRLHNKRQHQRGVNTAITLMTYLSLKSMETKGHFRIGLQPILQKLHSFQWELCCKHYRSVHSALMLTLGVNGTNSFFCILSFVASEAQCTVK